MIARLLISAALERRKEEIDKILVSHKLTLNHPDLLYFPYTSKLGIAEARKIKEFFSLKPYSAKGRVVVLEDASALTSEAQNALLKTLEELPKEALFILCASSDASFLPTVLSRCQIILLPMPGMGYIDIPGFSAHIEKLLNSSIAERFEYVEKLKDREEFLQSLSQSFHTALLEYRKETKNAIAQNVPLKEIETFLKELLQAEEWQKQNVNIRAILEYLMLVMPQK